MSDAPQSQSTNRPSGVTNVLDILGIDIDVLRQISETKTNFLLNYSRLNLPVALAQLKDLLSTMLDVMEKAFKDDIKGTNQVLTHKTTINGKEYNFYDLYKLVNNNEIVDRNDLRVVMNAEFSIYNYFASVLGQKIPTEKVKAKKNF